MADRTCFLVSPIRKAGTAEFEHYRALYETVLRPTLSEIGYSITRADDIAKSGAITADIVRLLATSDLVVADLSELNPNVFYELGVRHALRGTGTIMIVDTSTTEVPFDLKPYRVIEFASDLRGIERLRENLVQFTRSLASPTASSRVRDNPVHDHLPSLPEDIYAYAEGSTEGELREEVARLKQRLARYTETYGVDSEEADEASAFEVVSAVLLQAQRGELPITLYYKARSAARESQHESFLLALSQILESASTSLSARQYRALAQDASTLELPEDVELVLLEKAIEQNPNDPLMRHSYFGVLAHSKDPKSRERARRELRLAAGITITEDGTVDVSDVLEENVGIICVMLDAYNEDRMHTAARAITDKMAERFPMRSAVLRNHARVLAAVGEKDEAIATFERAMETSDVTDVTANWYGGELCNQGDGVAALVPFIRACELDPDDAVNFVRVAEDLSAILRGRYQKNSGPSDHFDVSNVKDALRGAFSCSVVPSGVVNRARSVVEELSLDGDLLHSLIRMRTNNDPDLPFKPLSRRERLDVLRKLVR